MPDQSSMADYSRARRQLVLISGILLVFQIVGIHVDPDKPLPYVNVRLKSPDAAPWILVALIVYFSARYLVEWSRLTDDERLNAGLRVDRAITGLVVFVSLATFAIQQVSRIQVADLMRWRDLIPLFSSPYAGLLLTLSILFDRLPEDLRDHLDSLGATRRNSKKNWSRLYKRGALLSMAITLGGVVMSGLGARTAQLGENQTTISGWIVAVSLAAIGGTFGMAWGRSAALKFFRRRPEGASG